jgi:hypothetical protein
MKRFKNCKRLLDAQKAAKVGWFCFRRKPNNPTWSKVAKVHPLGFKGVVRLGKVKRVETRKSSLVATNASKAQSSLSEKT